MQTALRPQSPRIITARATDAQGCTQGYKFSSSSIGWRFQAEPAATAGTGRRGIVGARGRLRRDGRDRNEGPIPGDVETVGAAIHRPGGRAPDGGEAGGPCQNGTGAS